MLQHHLLKTYAPHALQLVFRPADTGSPGQDFCTHVSANDAHRIDIEDAMIVGDGVIVKIEPDLASTDEREQEAKIASVLYAEKTLGNSADAVEFVRCVKLLAGEDARGLDLQIIASHYYGEINVKKRPVTDVLKEMALLAMELSSVTSTNEQRLFDEPVETAFPFVEEPMTVSDRRAFSMRRASEVLGEVELTAADLFHLEIRALSYCLQGAQAQGFEYDDEAQFWAHAREQVGSDEELLEALMDSYVRVSEQYDEGGVVSLHMSDGEKVVVLGTLDDDVDASYLPAEARHLAAALRRAYIGGEGAQAARKLMADVRLQRAVIAVKRRFRSQGQAAVQAALATIPAVGDVSTFSIRPLSEGELVEWMDCATSSIYNSRTKRTARAEFMSRSGNRLGRPTTFTTPFTITVNPDAETRLFVQQVLEKLLDQMKGDFHLRAQRSNQTYKMMHHRIRTARDTALVASTIKEAFKAKEEGRLSLALFTALNTSAKLQRWSLESERVSQGCSRLLREIAGATRQKLMYLRWAMYGENQPNHPIHQLPRQEKARVWDALKAATNMATPLAEAA